MGDRYYVFSNGIWHMPSTLPDAFRCIDAMYACMHRLAEVCVYTTAEVGAIESDHVDNG